MGLAGSFGAVGVGMGTMAAAGGVFGLGIYGLYKAFQQQPGQRMAGAVDAFDRMESNVLEREAYSQALLELELEYLERNFLAEWTWKQKFAALEVEEELEALKAQLSERYKEVKGDNFISSEPNFSDTEVTGELLPTESRSPHTWQCINILQGHEASVQH